MSASSVCTRRFAVTGAAAVGIDHIRQWRVDAGTAAAVRTIAVEFCTVQGRKSARGPPAVANIAGTVAAEVLDQSQAESAGVETVTVGLIQQRLAPEFSEVVAKAV